MYLHDCSWSETPQLRTTQCRAWRPAAAPSRGAEVDVDCSGTETLWTLFVVYVLSLRCIRVTGKTTGLEYNMCVCMTL
jgi:hypothetical protein